ncbi:sulfite exporter TauE/SafE family protein [Sphingobacterium cavernae]|uniref:sulfite exporter TauE/SafE family protein n=1 Tax=Sphingobacterium cavernae TaxID=2592657 RepID=UPI00122FE97F|nr:sulfite exporter TauE/SafE family protein [Sphingobacterium cavernae]
MEIIAYVAAILIGVLLGLIGGGGSILTVPVLVYMFAVLPVTATAYSLFIVGATSVVGSITYFKKGLVNIKTATVFGIPSIFAVFLPTIPYRLFTLPGFELTKDIFLMILFAVLMVVAAYTMLKGKKSDTTTVVQPQKFNYPMILLEGSFVGVFTGLVGAGGGFLIIPALVLFSKLPMKEAVGTSLAIIAAKSLIGYTGELGNATLDWTFLLTLTSLSILVIFIGSYLTRF